MKKVCRGGGVGGGGDIFLKPKFINFSSIN